MADKKQVTRRTGFALMKQKEFDKLLKSEDSYRRSDGGGLYLQSKGGRAKSWIFRYQMGDGGKRWEIGLGSAHAIGLAEAREKAAEARAMVRNNINPNKQKGPSEDLPVTFKEYALKYIEEKRTDWSNAKHADQWANTLETYVFPKIGDMVIADIRVHSVLEVLRPIWNEKPETASRVRARIERILGAATVHELRTGDNPAKWGKFLSEVLPRLPDGGRQPALPYVQMSEFINELRNRQGIAAKALEFSILTASRSGAVCNARWSEIDQDKQIWTSPAGNMKTKVEHSVPLSKRAIEILKSLPGGKPTEFIFASPVAGRDGGAMSTDSLRKTISDINETRIKNQLEPFVDPKQDGKQIVPHGFRSSFRDWAAEATDYPRDAVEMALAHTVGNKVEAAYRRGTMIERRHSIMDDWAAWCELPKDECQKILEQIAQQKRKVVEEERVEKVQQHHSDPDHNAII